MADATLGPLRCTSTRPIYFGCHCLTQKRTQTLVASTNVAESSDAAASEGADSWK